MMSRSQPASEAREMCAQMMTIQSADDQKRDQCMRKSRSTNKSFFCVCVCVCYQFRKVCDCDFARAKPCGNKYILYTIRLRCVAARNVIEPNQKNLRFTQYIKMDLYLYRIVSFLSLMSASADMYPWLVLQYSMPTKAQPIVPDLVIARIYLNSESFTSKRIIYLMCLIARAAADRVAASRRYRNK